ncbi:MAG: hypothetical protein QGG42_06560 [Phycisphaerae bacterium]|nr:hypothetical protein [Phycisphaerae bacterium]
MRKRTSHKRALLVALIGTICFCGCAGVKPTVFDKVSLAKVHKLMVVPMQASLDRSTDPIVAEMAAERLQLQMAGSDDFAVLIAPSLWRLKPGSGASPTDQQAVKMARKAGAQAVLTGTIGYSVALSDKKGLPSAAGKGVSFARHFATRRGSGSIQLRMLRTEDGMTIYNHTALARGRANDQALSEALAKAMGPLETYLKAQK